jgi:alpha-tubulin suppressor-like RCC1 family protein
MCKVQAGLVGLGVTLGVVAGGCELVLATDPNPTIIITVSGGSGGATSSSATGTATTGTGGTGTTTGTGGGGGCAGCTGHCVDSTCNEPVYIAGGYQHTCAVLKDGSAWCWGLNVVGELGDGTTAPETKPTQIALPGSAVQIGAKGVFVAAPSFYEAHTCAVLADHSLWCWGSNDSGELGTGNTTASLSPVKANLANVKQVAVGGAHTCAVTLNDDLYCWGANSSGEVGDGMPGADVWSPTKILSSVSQVAAGSSHSCAVTLAGSLLCWGSDSHAQLGNNSMTSPQSPFTVFPAGMGALQVACGKGHTCARVAGTLFCWGDNGAGQLGLGDKLPRLVPQAVNVTGVSLVSAGDFCTGAIGSGSLFMWGENGDGELGDGTPTSMSTPEATGLNNLSMMGHGEKHSCALTTAGQMLCWGSNAFGQLGDGTVKTKLVPTPVVWE